MREIRSVYVAASSAEMSRAVTWMERLKLAGIRVTSNWPALIAEVGDANPLDATQEQRFTWASRQRREVASADLLWLLMPVGGSFGAMWELGCADGLGKIQVVSGEGIKRTIFTAFAVQSFDTDEDGFAFVCRMVLESERARPVAEGRL